MKQTKCKCGECLIAPDVYKETWFGGNGKAFHYHDKRGTPICGSGWFSTGRKALALPDKACKRCVAIVTDYKP